MKLSIVPVSVCALLCIAFAANAGTEPTHEAPHRSYLKPDLSVGEQMTHIFSKAVSIKGQGFKEVVWRTSGTSRNTITDIKPEAIFYSATYRYDGGPIGSGTGKGLTDWKTNCWEDKCRVNRETSGAVFNRTLWGDPPQELHVGGYWTAHIDKPWEAGPAGVETVRVVQIDPSNNQVTLVREGSGTPASAASHQTRQVTITTTRSKQLKVTVTPGKTTWRGRTIVRNGVIISDVIMVTRPVTLVSDSGQTFKGKERIYTLENLLRART